MYYNVVVGCSSSKGQNYCNSTTVNLEIKIFNNNSKTKRVYSPQYFLKFHPAPYVVSGDALLLRHS